MEYIYKTQPRPYQKLIIERTAAMPQLALFLEQGLGKTKVALDSMAIEYLAGGAEAVIVVSKKVVVENWYLNEVPIHLNLPHHSYLYTTQRYKKLPPPRFMPQGVLKIILINDGCVRTPHGIKYLQEVIKRFSTGMVIDESTLIKNPTALLTKRLIALGKDCVWKRIMCGEPAPQGATDYYSQFQFLSPHILNIGTFTAYKNIFCEQEEMWLNGRQIRKPTRHFLSGKKETFEELVKPYTIRLRKSEVLKDLPEKQYNKVVFEMDPVSRKLYDKLTKDFVVELSEAKLSGELTATMAISRLIRLHQIASGFVTSDDGEVKTLESKRQEVLHEILDERPNKKTIIWAHYRRNIEDIHRGLEYRFGAGSSEYLYGGLGDNERNTALVRFKSDPTCRFLVANPATAGWGLTLTEADAAIYYSNSYNFEHRVQSEDRIHRIGQESDTVDYYDIVAHDTVDSKILEVLEDKADFSKSVLNNLDEWFKLR